tara:strand:- start:113 stop:415 length:303 start_codon:yes stop_codon:yes gene_type:complete
MSSEDDSGSSLPFLVGFIAGTIFGGILGVLFAPQSGENVRAELLDKSSKLRTNARDLGHTSQEALRDAITEGRDAAVRARQEMEEWVEQARSTNGDGSDK